MKLTLTVSDGGKYEYNRTDAVTMDLPGANELEALEALIALLQGQKSCVERQLRPYSPTSKAPSVDDVIT